MRIKLIYLTEEEYVVQDFVDYGNTSISSEKYQRTEFNRSYLNLNKTSEKKAKHSGLIMRGLTFYYHNPDEDTRWRIKIRGNKAAVNYLVKF